MMKIVKKIKKYPLLSIILLSIIIRIIYLIIYPTLWWDSHVYIGMGKYIFSSGQLGIWEPFRPLIYPGIIGFFWKIGFNPILAGKIFDLIFSVLNVYLVYLLGKRIFNKKIAIWGSLLFSLTPEFLRFTGMILTEPLAIFFGLISVYLFIKKRLFWSGLFIGLSFLTKFPQGLLLPALVLSILLIKDKFINKIKNSSLIGVGFLLMVTPYLLFNYFTYVDMWMPLTYASWIVTADTWLYGTGFTHYLLNFFLINPIYLFFFSGIYFFFKNKEYDDQKRTFILINILLHLAYFSFYVPRKEARYLLLTLPFLALFVIPSLIKLRQKIINSKIKEKTSRLVLILIIVLPFIPVIYFSGIIAYLKYMFVAIPFFSILLVIFSLFIHQLIKKTKILKLKKIIFIVFVGILVVIPFIFSGIFIFFQQPITLEKEYVEVIKENHISGNILVSNPSLMSYLNQPITALNGVDYAETIYNQTKHTALILSDCDLPCHPENQVCLNLKNNFLNKIKKENKLIFYQKTNDTIRKKVCEHFIYVKNKIN